MDLAGKVFVVAGAGVAGEAVADGLLRHGATVALTSRSPQRLASVQDAAASPHLHGFSGGLETLAGVESVRDRIVAALGPPTGVVAALGGWWEGPPLTRLDPTVWQRILDDNLTSHFLAARAFLPHLAGRPGTSYVMLGGVAATMPLPHAAPISVTGAAQTSLLENLAAEGTGVRLHEVRIMTPVITRHWDRTDQEPGWLTGRQVGDHLAAVVSPGFPRRDQLILTIPEP